MHRDQFSVAGSIVSLVSALPRVLGDAESQIVEIVSLHFGHLYGCFGASHALIPGRQAGGRGNEFLRGQFLFW